MSSATAEAAGARGDGAGRVTGAAAPVPTPAATWTEERIETLRWLWGEGVPAREIARRIGVSWSAVIGKAHRLMLPMRQAAIGAHRKNPQADAVLALWQQPDRPTQQEIAARLGITKSAVKGIVQRADVERRTGGRRRAPPAETPVWRLPALPKAPKPRAAPKPRIVAPKPAPPPPPRLVLVARPGERCHWPTTDGVGFRFECTSPAVAGACSPYCAEHLARAWDPLPKRRAA